MCTWHFTFCTRQSTHLCNPHANPIISIVNKSSLSLFHRWACGGSNLYKMTLQVSDRTRVHSLLLTTVGSGLPAARVFAIKANRALSYFQTSWIRNSTLADGKTIIVGKCFHLSNLLGHLLYIKRKFPHSLPWWGCMLPALTELKTQGASSFYLEK